MTDQPNAFLTDERRAVLAGAYEGEENVERTHKSRIRARARSALAELTEVARSEEIDNADVFEPEAVGTLLFWILRDPARLTDLEGGGLVKDEDLPDSYQQYRNSLYVEIDKQMRKFDRPEEGRF